MQPLSSIFDRKTFFHFWLQDVEFCVSKLKKWDLKTFGDVLEAYKRIGRKIWFNFEKLDFASESFIFSSMFLEWALWQIGSELWWSFHEWYQVGGCPTSLRNFFRYAQGHHEAHTRALEQMEQPLRVCFTMEVIYRTNFYIKIAVKYSLSARFLTEKLFLTFDFSIMNLAFLNPRNEIWIRLGVFLKLTNLLDPKYGSILKKLDFASESFIFSSMFLEWALCQIGSELWWSLHEYYQVGGCLTSLRNFFRDAQGHHEAHTRALEKLE